MRRYGFHGLSYEYIAYRLPEVAPDIARGRVIVAHLGSGASMCALFDGRSVESTMGFTALDGLPMGTRPGQIDPGVVLYLMAEKGMDAVAVQHFLYHDCGLKGLSGVSNDMRELEASCRSARRFRDRLFRLPDRAKRGNAGRRARRGRCDSCSRPASARTRSRLRARVAERLAWLGAKLDANANSRGETRISSPDSRIALYVVPTDEELMIARHTLALFSGCG